MVCKLQWKYESEAVTNGDIYLKCIIINSALINAECIKTLEYVDDASPLLSNLVKKGPKVESYFFSDSLPKLNMLEKHPLLLGERVFAYEFAEKNFEMEFWCNKLVLYF